MQINATQKGVITGCVMAAIECFLFYHFREQSVHYQYLVLLLSGVGIMWSMIDFSKTATPSTKFGSYFGNGFKTFVVITLFIVVCTVILYILHPEIRDAWIAVNREALLKEGNHTPAEITEYAQKMKSIYIPMMICMTVFLYLLTGAIITLLSSLVIIQTKKA